MTAVFWELPYAISIWGSEEVYVNGFKVHIRSRKKEWERWENPARRWVVERAFARLKTFRSLRTRYCYFLANLMGPLSGAGVSFEKNCFKRILCRTSS